MTTTEAYAALGTLLDDLDRTKREDEEGYNFRVGLLRKIGLAIQEAYANGGGGGGGASELTDLTDVSTAAVTNRFALIANGTSYVGRALTVADISDFGTYLTSETNDLTATVTWANVPDVNITESSVTQHQAALSITESQISDLGTYLTSETSHADVLVDGDFATPGIMLTDGSGNYSIATNNITNWNTAFGWGNHASAGYITTVDNNDWSGVDLSILNGGTGASTAAAARTNLGLVIGTDIQAYDADLQAISGLTSAANKGIYYTGAGTAALFDITAAARTILDDSSTSAIRTTLGIGTSDSPQFTGINVGNVSDTTITRVSAGNIGVEGNLVYRANGTDVPITDGGTGASTASAARTNLGLAIRTDVAPWRTTSSVNTAGSPIEVSLSVHTYLCDAAAGNMVIQLPTAAAGANTVWRILKIDATANNVSITPDGTETINGSTGAVNLTSQWRGSFLTSDGSGGWVLNQLA